MEKHLYGFDIRCEILGTDVTGYKIMVITSHPYAESEIWPVPDDRLYSTRGEAEARAERLIMGITSVEPSGKPNFTVG